MLQPWRTIASGDASEDFLATFCEQRTAQVGKKGVSPSADLSTVKVSFDSSCRNRCGSKIAMRKLFLSFPDGETGARRIQLIGALARSTSGPARFKEPGTRIGF